MRAGRLAIGLALVAIVVMACGQEQQEDDDFEAEADASTASETSPMPTSAELLPHQDLARAILKELIEIDTTDSKGDNTAAAQAMAERLLAAGFPAEDVQVLGPVERKGNLVARYRGRDSGRKPLLLLAHIDVVEADPADWTLDPFTFIESV